MLVGLLQQPLTTHIVPGPVTLGERMPGVKSQVDIVTSFPL